MLYRMTRSLYRSLVLVMLVGGVWYLYQTKLPSTQSAATADFGGVSLSIEYATTSETRERGLGGRESVPENYGMLFVFSKDDWHGFWMKDMLVPIDMFWLDAQGHVVSIVQDAATSTYPGVFYPSAPARYVLETAAGFARAHGIEIGIPLLLKNFERVSE